MEEKKVFGKFEIVRLKRTAQNLYQYEKKLKEVEKELKRVSDEYDSLKKIIEATDAPTKLLTGGYGTKDIIRTTLIPTDKVNSKGEIITKVYFDFIYPDTIIPENKNEMSTFEGTNEEPKVEGI